MIRRAFLRTFGLGAAGAVASTLPSATLTARKNVAANALSDSGLVMPAGNTNPIIQLALSAYKAQIRKQHQKLMLRDGPFDADIAVMRSSTYATKVRQQLERDLEQASFSDELAKKAFGDW